DPAEVKCHPPHQLHVEVALADDPPGPLPHHRERLDQQIVEGLPPVQALPELDGAVPQGLVVEGLDLGLEVVDHRHDLLQATELLPLARAQHLGEDAHRRPSVPRVLAASPPPLGHSGDSARSNTLCHRPSPRRPWPATERRAPSGATSGSTSRRQKALDRRPSSTISTRCGTEGLRSSPAVAGGYEGAAPAGGRHFVWFHITSTKG